MSESAILTITTDFGDSAYPAAMKGVILSINPDATLIDIDHHVPPQNIRLGALVLTDTCQHFPEDSIHVAVVDPGVGTDPLPGGNALYVNSGFVGKIVELNPLESDRLLAMLYDHIAYSVGIQCRVKWEPDTVVFWDNRCVQHYAVNDYQGMRRRMHRITIAGDEVPVSG